MVAGKQKARRQRRQASRLAGGSRQRTASHGGDAVGDAAEPHGRCGTPDQAALRHMSATRNHQAERPEIAVIGSFAGEHVGATLLHAHQFCAGHLSHGVLHRGRFRGSYRARRARRAQRAQCREPSHADARVVTSPEAKARVGAIADICTRTGVDVVADVSVETRIDAG